MAYPSLDEIRGLMHDLFAGWHAESVAREELINVSLKNIEEHLRKINGSIVEHAQKIEALKDSAVRHKEDCPAFPMIEEIKKNIIGTWLRKNWKLAILIAVVSYFIMYMIFETFKFIDLVAIGTKLIK